MLIRVLLLASLSLLASPAFANACQQRYAQLQKNHAPLSDYQKLLKDCGQSARLKAQIETQIGDLQATQHQFAAALQAYRGALAYWQQQNKTRQSGEVLSKIGETLLAKGDYQNAKQTLQQALQTRQKALGKDHVDLALTLDRLAETQRHLGELKAAETLYQQALELREKALGKDALALAYSLNDLALVYQQMDQIAKAEALFRRSLAIKEKHLGKEHPHLASSLNNLALLYNNQANYAKAEPLYQRALAIRTAQLAEDDPRLARSLNNLALLYMNLGKFAEAEPLYQRALAIREKALGPEHPDVAVSLHTLGLLQHKQEHFAEAEKLYQRALRIQRRALGDEHPQVGSLLNNLAALYRQQGKVEQADALYQHALAIRESRLGSQHSRVAHSLHNLALSYLRSQQPQAAEPLLLRALRINSQQEQYNPALHWLLLYQLSQTQQMQAHPAAAIFFAKQGLNALQTWRGDIQQLDKDLRESFLKDKSHAYVELADLLLAQTRLHEAQQILAMLKEEDYFDFIGRDAATDLRFTQADYTEQEQSWLAEYHRLQQSLLIAESKTGEAAVLREARAALRQWLGDIQTSQTQRLSRIQTKLDVTLKKKLQTLDEAVAYVQYLSTPEHLHILLSTRQTQRAYRQDLSSVELNRAALAFYEALLNLSEPPLSSAQTLYQHLLAPLAETLQKEHIDTLLLSLDGLLHYLPFAALHDGEHYLTERYRIVRYNSAARTELKPTPVQNWRAVGLGLSKEIPGFAPLPTVPGELAGIIRAQDADGGILPGSIYLNQDFDRPRLGAALHEDYPVMHIASHFVFEPGTDEHSYLLLGNGDKLSLRSIRGELDFKTLDLLTLSACNTALGDGRDDIGGREIEGFGALAQHQGARSVLASLWAVNDESTGQFMQQFYHHLLQPGQNKAQALQAAQQAFLQAGQAAKEQSAHYPYFYAHPYYWAAFVLMGNWQ